MGSIHQNGTAVRSHAFLFKFDSKLRHTSQIKSKWNRARTNIEINSENRINSFCCLRFLAWPNYHSIRFLVENSIPARDCANMYSSCRQAAIDEITCTAIREFPPAAIWAHPVIFNWTFSDSKRAPQHRMSDWDIAMPLFFYKKLLRAEDLSEHLNFRARYGTVHTWARVRTRHAPFLQRYWYLFAVCRSPVASREQRIRTVNRFSSFLPPTDRFM